MNEFWLFKTKERLLDETDVLYNLYGDYTYLLEGYYETLQSQLEGINIHPTTQESLDAYISVILMEKAKNSNIPVPVFKIMTEKTKKGPYPVLCYSMNPAARNSFLIENDHEFEIKIKTLTLNGRYFALLQEIPAGEYRVDTVRCILGRCLVKEYSDFCRLVFTVFKIPLSKIKVIVTLDQYLLSSVEPLDFDTLTINEKKMLEEMGEWQK